MAEVNSQQHYNNTIVRDDKSKGTYTRRGQDRLIDDLRKRKRKEEVLSFVRPLAANRNRQSIRSIRKVTPRSLMVDDDFLDTRYSSEYNLQLGSNRMRACVKAKPLYCTNNSTICVWERLV